MNFQDIEVGKAVRPQLAMRVADATAAWKKVLGQKRLNNLDHLFSGPSHLKKLDYILLSCQYCPFEILFPSPEQKHIITQFSSSIICLNPTL